VKIDDLGITIIVNDVLVPLPLIRRLLRLNDNHLIQLILGPKGHCYFFSTRLQPYQLSSAGEPLYRCTLAYSYPSIEDSQQTKNESSEEVILDMISKVKQWPESELREIIREIYERRASNHDLDAKDFASVKKRHAGIVLPKPWKTSRVTFLGDSIHAMTGFRGQGNTVNCILIILILIAIIIINC
jgi:2-polyprenyl-6-methoxyphenol hydroxylase-like FAD-dependent oxidoreductase